MASAALLDAGEANIQDLVTPEEIELYSVPEGLTDLERAQLYLGGGRAVQQLALLANLPGLVRAAGRAAWVAVSKGLADLVRGLNGEGQVVAAQALAALAREHLLPPLDVAEGILPLALAGVGEGASAGAAAQAAWLACLGDAAAAVDPGTLHTRVLPALAARGPGAVRSPRDRCLCAQLLGAVAPHASGEDLHRSLLRLGAMLCQDTEWQVRHAVAQALPALAGGAGAKLEAAALVGVLGDLFGLVEDEEALVRAAAWRSLCACLDLLPPELRRMRLLPLLLRQCRDTDHHADVQRALAEGFGALMGRLVADMEGDADVAACLACYRGLAWRHDHATRLACAAAFPAVLRAGTARRYGSHLHDALTRLAGDAGHEVRLAVAAALPDVAAALGRERCCQYLRQPAAALLQDEHAGVVAALLARLPDLFAQFNPTGATAASAAAAEEQRAKVFGPFVEPLLRAEAGSGTAWRLQAAWLAAAAALPAFLPPEPLHDRFLPLALKYLAEGVAAVRDAAAAAVAALWRALRKPGQRTALYGRLVREFAQARGHRQRAAFLDLVRHAQAHFSCKFVKAHLLEPALALCFDRVPNVRAHVAGALPGLKAAVALPDDVHLLEVLNSGMSHLITDGDADVRQAARKARCRTNEAFKHLPVRMSCGALESSSQEVKAFEAADAARADAERAFTFDADGLERIRADIAAYAEQVRPADARLALALPSTRGDGASGASSRLGTSRSGAGAGRALGGAKARSARSGTDAAEGVRRDKGLLGGMLYSRAASVDGQQRPGASKGAKPPARQRGLAATPHSSKAPSPLAAAAGATADHSSPAAAAAAGSPAAGPAEQRAQEHAPGSPGRLGQPSPGSAARIAASASRLGRPSPTSAASGSLRQSAVSQSPAAVEQLVAELAAGPPSVRHLAGGGHAASSAASSVQRRPSLRAGASRAAAEVQNLARQLKSALLSPAPRGQPAAAAAAGGPTPAPARAPGSVRPHGKAKGGAVAVRVSADDRHGRGAARSSLQHGSDGR